LSSQEEEKFGAVGDGSEEQGPSKTQAPMTIKSYLDAIPPFMLTHDLARGLLVVFQAAITYALMLSIMYVHFYSFHRQQK